MVQTQRSSGKIWTACLAFIMGGLLLSSCGTPPSTTEVPEGYVIGSMTPEPHAVGFKVFHELNYADTFGSMWDDQGKSLTSEAPRPVQISVWYPASSTTPRGPMRVKDYLLLDATLTEFRVLDEAEQAAYVQDFIASARYIIPPHPDLVEKHLNLATTAHADAPHEQGSFPLIILTTELNASPWNNAVMAEYLASHGYIVAATAAKGAQPGASSAVDPPTTMAMVRDARFIKAFMRDFQGFDGSNVVIIGERSGGWAAALLANRDPQVRAMVLLAPSLNAQAAEKIFPAETSLDADVFRKPLLHISGATQGRGEAATFPFGDDILYADVYHAKVKGMERPPSFSSSSILLYLKTARHDRIMGLPDVEIGYEQSIVAVRSFLDSIMDGQTGAQFIADELNPDIATVEYSTGLAAPPTSAGFFSIFEEQGGDAAGEVLQRVRSDNPDYELFTPAEALAFATQLRNGGRYEEYLAFSSIVESMLPDHALAYFLKGEALMLHKRSEEAKTAMQRMQELKPSGTIAFQAMGLLKELGIRPEGETVPQVPVSFSSRSMEGVYPFAQPYNDPSRFSPDREVRAEVGGTELLIEYGSPKVRGRRVLDELVPTHVAWRTGANEASVFTCRADVLVQGERLPAGSYSLFSMGKEDEWSIIFNRVNQQWGAYSYDPVHDQLRVKAPASRGEHVEDFTISIEDADGGGVDVTLAWGERRTTFRVEAAQ